MLARRLADAGRSRARTSYSSAYAASSACSCRRSIARVARAYEASRRGARGCSPARGDKHLRRAVSNPEGAGRRVLAKARFASPARRLAARRATRSASLAGVHSAGSRARLWRHPGATPRPSSPTAISIQIQHSRGVLPPLSPRRAHVRPTTRELTFSDGFRLLMGCCRIPFGSGFVAPRAKSIDRDGRGRSGMVGSVGLGETAGRPGWDLTLRARYFLGIAVSSAICLKEKSEPKCQRVLSGMSAAHANSLREKRVPPHREIFRCVFAMTAGKLSDD